MELYDYIVDYIKSIVIGRKI